VYSGYEKGDFCYYRPQRFTDNFQPYIEKMQLLSEEMWKPIQNWSEITQETFPLIKAVGTEEEMLQIVDHIKQRFKAEISIIRDPLSEMFHLALITDFEATKGNALKRMASLLRSEGPIIAAGDDRNDISMLENAAVKIVMKTAPKSMHQMADILAQSSIDRGIIPALEKALKWIEERSK